MKVSDAVLHEGITRFGLHKASLRFLGGEDGDVFEVARAGKPHILKLVPTAADRVAALAEKADFAAYLHQHGVRLSLPVPSPAGRRVEIVQDGESLVAVSLYVKAPGKHPDPGDPTIWNEALFRQWGQVVGRMHRLAGTYHDGEHIPTWREEHAFMAEWLRDEAVKTRWLSLGEHLRHLPTPDGAYGLIHNDLHQFNFMLHGGEITLFDFDVCTHHWFMTDIGIAVFHALWPLDGAQPEARTAFAQAFLAAFMAGYELEHCLDPVWLAELPVFLKYRQILLYTVFNEPWGAQDADGWQRAWVKQTRERILADAPVVELDAIR